MKEDKPTLGFLLSRASNSMAANMNSTLKKKGIDLPHSQFVVLRCLFFNDGLSQLEIAKLLSKDAAAIKRTVDNLEQKGLVIRTQVRTLKNSICVTNEGHELMPRVLTIAQEVTDKALQGIDDEYKTLLWDMLNKIYENLENQ